MFFFFYITAIVKLLNTLQIHANYIVPSIEYTCSIWKFRSKWNVNVSTFTEMHPKVMRLWRVINVRMRTGQKKINKKKNKWRWVLKQWLCLSCIWIGIKPLKTIVLPFGFAFSSDVSQFNRCRFVCDEWVFIAHFVVISSIHQNICYYAISSTV